METRSPQKRANLIKPKRLEKSDDRRKENTGNKTLSGRTISNIDE